MTTPRTLVLSAIFSLALPSGRAMAADGWGASYSFGPSTSRIIYAKTVLVPGRLPPITSSTGPLFIWPGMSNSKGDLIQTTMDAWPDNKGYCAAAAGQWCVEASVFGSFGQKNGPTVAIAPTDQVTIEYQLGADGNTWTQTVSKLCKVVSTLKSASGPMPGTGFGFATEADADSYTIDTQYYLSTEFHFAEADPKFSKTGVGGVGAKYGATGTGSGIGTAKNVRTPDGGLTWLVDLITLPAMQPQGTQSGVPTAGPACPGSGGTAGGAGAAGASSGGTSAGGAGTGGRAGAGAGGSGASGAGNPDSGGASGAGSSVGGSSGNKGVAGSVSSGGSAGNTTGGGNAGSVAGGAAGSGPLATGGEPESSSNDPSGCSCRVGDAPSHGGWLGLLAAAAWGLGLERRRRARPRASEGGR